MTVAQLLAYAPSSELSEWSAFYRIESEDADSEQKRQDMHKFLDSISGE